MESRYSAALIPKFASNGTTCLKKINQEKADTAATQN